MSPSTARSEARPPPAAAWRLLLVAAALATCAWGSHVLMVRAAGAPWAVALLFGPLLLAVGGAALARRQWPVLAGCAVAVALLALVTLRGPGGGIERLYVLQHAGIHLALAWFFGSTLRAGATPLITALAATLHNRFTPEMRAYTRWLTRLWAGYFVAMVALSLSIYALAPWPWWSLFCNVLTPLAAAGLFVGEHLLRYRRHPEFERVTLRGAVQAYRRHGGAAAARTTEPAA
jgi:uncharacterized membrane protein